MMFRNKTKRVLVIGGRGFIGSHLLADDLFMADESKYLYTVLDIKDGPLGDVNSDAWAESFYDVIVFLACDFRENIDGYVENARMIASVGWYLEANPKTQLIYTSSAAVYQDSYRSMKETDVDPIGAPTHYGQGKLLGEMGLQASQPRATVLRLSNVHGKGGRGVADLIKKGNRIVYGSGMQVRDFVPVEQVVNTIVDAIKNPKKWQGVFNVSTGRGLTVLNIYRDYGKGSPIFKKARPKDVRFSVLDNTKWLKQWK
jgi:nucleoside-diphosphate-sugar epimerase